MTQGKLLLLTIFNAGVDKVVHHWESLMEEGNGGEDRYNSSRNEVAKPERQTIRMCDDKQQWTEEGLKVREAILYADNGMVASTEPRLPQTAFYTLTGLFDQVGVKTNVQKLWIWSAIHVGCPGYRHTKPLRDE